MTATQPLPWSDNLQAQTRQAIADLQMGPDGKLHFKHKTLGYGVAEITDLVKEPLVIYSKLGETRWSHAQVDALLAAGWAID